MASETLVAQFEARAALPDAKATKPSTVMVTNAVTGLARTWIIRTARHPQEGFGIFLQMAEPDGITQLVLPEKVCQAIYRQRDALMDRSTPQSRAKKRAATEAAKRKKERADRKAKWAAANPGRKPGQPKAAKPNKEAQP